MFRILILYTFTQQNIQPINFKMEENFTRDEHLEQVNYTREVLKREYENCHFQTCNLSNVNLSGIVFLECSFGDCNFSSAELKNTAFRDCSFTSCKMIGLRFEECDPFLLSFSFKNCDLSYTSFFQLKIPKTSFKKCKMEQVEFTGANCSGADFSEADLLGSSFGNTNLEKADFRSACNFSIDPEQSHMANAKFSQEDLSGLLTKYKLKVY